MDNYFTSMIEKLSINELSVLNILTKTESTNRFSALTKKKLLAESNLTESSFRKIILRLEAMNLIDIATGNREHLLFVTEYGQHAIQTIYERGNV